MKRFAFLLCFLLPALVYAVDPPKLPTEVKVAPGRLAAINIEWDGDSVQWTQPAELDVFREYTPDPKVVRLRVIGYKAGRYEFFAVTAKAEDGVAKLSEFAKCVVVVGSPPDPGPDPDPDPDPIPIPVDEFERGIFSAWKEENPNAAKIERIKFLADIYSEAATLAENSQDLKTVYQLYQTGVLGAVQNNFKPIADPAAEFVTIRKLIGSELNAKLSTKINEPLDPNRALCAREFRRVAAVLNRLEKVK